MGEGEVVSVLRKLTLHIISQRTNNGLQMESCNACKGLDPLQTFQEKYDDVCICETTAYSACKLLTNVCRHWYWKCSYNLMLLDSKRTCAETMEAINSCRTWPRSQGELYRQCASCSAVHMNTSGHHSLLSTMDESSRRNDVHDIDVLQMWWSTCNPQTLRAQEWHRHQLQLCRKESCSHHHNGKMCLHWPLK